MSFLRNVGERAVLQRAYHAYDNIPHVVYPHDQQTLMSQRDTAQFERDGGSFVREGVKEMANRVVVSGLVAVAAVAAIVVPAWIQRGR